MLFHSKDPVTWDIAHRTITEATYHQISLHRTYSIFAMGSIILFFKPDNSTRLLHCLFHQRSSTGRIFTLASWPHDVSITPLARLSYCPSSSLPESVSDIHYTGWVPSHLGPSLRYDRTGNILAWLFSTGLHLSYIGPSLRYNQSGQPPRLIVPYRSPPQLEDHHWDTTGVAKLLPWLSPAGIHLLTTPLAILLIWVSTAGLSTLP